MKLADIVQVIAKELGTSDIKEINKRLKSESAVKFRITGKALGHFGFTGQIKSISEEGIKAFMANKVSLIRLADIETFEKAKPREERPVRPAKTQVVAPTKPKAPSKKTSHQFDDEDFEDSDDHDEFRAKKLKDGKGKSSKGKSGSKFIPSGKK
ncbi:hypothetical protein [Bdellovibrio sp. HCB2-146]|uniref:hypothetical protein n=1 Tax=Bdellovibrio sp. HCB2-146 TaxID=3394362 RepID=UPI0039BC3838